MQDYMRELHLRFKGASPQTQALEKERNFLRKQLRSRLNKSERKLLLRLTDLEDELREQESLDSFVSGFRLANGIQQELSELPPYSFEAEDEQQAREIFERGE